MLLGDSPGHVGGPAIGELVRRRAQATDPVPWGISGPDFSRSEGVVVLRYKLVDKLADRR